MFKLNVKQNQLNNIWFHIKNSPVWWVFVLALLGFFVIVLIFTPQASRLILTFLAIPLLALIFFVMFTLLSTQPDKVYQTLFEQNDEGIFIADLNGKIMNVNQRVSELLGYTKAELVQLSFRDVVSSEAIPQAESVIQQLLAGKSVPLYERLARHKDGTLIPVEVSVRLIRDGQGNPQHIQSQVRDVTERKRIEQAVVNREKRLRMFAESLPDRAVILDRDANYRDILKSRDIDDQYLTFIGRNVSEIFSVEFGEFCKGIIQKAIAEKTRQSIEYVYHDAKGDIFLEGHITPITEPETGETVVMWVTRDVTERKRSEQVIINSEKRLRTFAEALPDRAVIFDREGTYRDVMRSRYADLKYVYDDVIKRNVSELYDVEFATFCKQMVQKTLDEHKPQLIEYVFHSLEGDLYLEGYLTPLNDPETGEEVVMWVIRDISERKRSQQALADSESRLRTFAEILPDRAVVLDREGNYRDVLKHWYDRSSFQPSPQNTTGRALHDVLPKDFADFCLKIVRQTLDANAIQVLEYTQTIGGQLIHFEGRVAPFSDPKSGERLVMWVSRNITERVQAEEQHLELTVEREKLTYLRNFVDSIIHDLKTPLTVIRTSLHLLERPQDENKRKARISSMYTQVDVITQMLDDLLAMARLDTMPNLPMAAVNLQALLEGIMVYLRPKAEHQSQDIHIHVETEALNILASEEELRRALTNLIDNAIKYTPEYGTISVRIACEGHETLVEVKDTGIGIKAEDLPHLFDRFFRSDNAKSHANGTGLGLAITKRIIELHGGHITVESQYQQGSTFRVWLPAELNIPTT